MESHQQKDAAAVRVFPPAVPLLTIVIGVGLSHLRPIDLGFALPKPARYWLGGLIVAGAFFGLGLWSVIVLRRTGQSENPWKPTTEIVESGPFRVTRNPLYLQMLLMLRRSCCDSHGLVDSGSDTGLRLVASKVGDPAGGSLPSAQVRRCLFGIQVSSSSLAMKRRYVV